MAERPIFVPVETGPRLVREMPISFTWNPGMAPSQKKKNIAALHKAASLRGLEPILEISSKSEKEIGRRLSAFNLMIIFDGREISIESAFQASKVFERGGPFKDLSTKGSRDARRDPRLKECGRLIGFEYEGERYSIWPKTAFYDWLYLNALFRDRDSLTEILYFAGFSDIEFNPSRSINCQARSCATFVALNTRGLLDDALESFGEFSALLQ
ncbi:MAG: DarT1-associated NADAR antitoxin family protein [Nitrospiraceae bacterium]